MLSHRQLLPALLAVAACGCRTDLPDEEPLGAGGVGAGGVGAGGVGAGGDGPTVVPEPTLLFVDRAPDCAAAAPTATATEALTPADTGEAAVVVELSFADECTGAGGQHIIMRELTGSREYWLGAHACYFFDASLLEAAPQFGVVRYRSTAALLQLDPNVCIGWPGEPPGLTSDSRVRAVGVFASQEEAEIFAAAID